jgi:crossover junction endodeoxyribonuclease RuvC
VIILGIDPGTAITGYGVIETKGNRNRLLGYGCIRTSAHTPPPERLISIYDKLNRLLEDFNPAETAIEQLFFNRNTTTAFSVAQARGVLVLACAQKGLPVNEYTPLQVKQITAGYGRADKTQIKFMVGRLLNMRKSPVSDDAADALAVALCHAHYSRSPLLKI